MLLDRLGLAERRACRITGQNRSTQRHHGRAAIATTRCAGGCGEISREHPRWGYRLAWALLRERGLGGQPQADPAPLARGGAARAAPAAQASPARRIDGARDAAAGRARPTTSGRSTSSSTPPSTADPEAAARRRRAHPRGPGDRGGPAHRRRRHRRPCWSGSPRRGAPTLIRMDNGPEMTAHAIRDWCRSSGAGTQLHRAGLALGEPVRRILRLPRARRGPRRRGVRLPARGAGRDRGLAQQVQHRETAQQPRWLAPAAYAASCRGD